MTATRLQSAGPKFVATSKRPNLGTWARWRLLRPHIRMQSADVLAPDDIEPVSPDLDVSLPLSDPYDAYTTWKSAKHAHEERLKDETGMHTVSTMSLEHSLGIEERRAARHRREIQELERIERQREQRERDAADREPVLIKLEKETRGKLKDQISEEYVTL